MHDLWHINEEKGEMVEFWRVKDKVLRVLG
jgi:hypothetical protein